MMGEGDTSNLLPHTVTINSGLAPGTHKRAVGGHYQQGLFSGGTNLVEWNPSPLRFNWSLPCIPSGHWFTTGFFFVWVYLLVADESCGGGRSAGMAFDLVFFSRLIIWLSAVGFVNRLGLPCGKKGAVTTRFNINYEQTSRLFPASQPSAAGFPQQCSALIPPSATRLPGSIATLPAASRASEDARRPSRGWGRGRG